MHRVQAFICSSIALIRNLGEYTFARSRHFLPTPVLRFTKARVKPTLRVNRTIQMCWKQNILTFVNIFSSYQRLVQSNAESVRDLLMYPYVFCSDFVASRFENCSDCDRSHRAEGVVINIYGTFVILLLFPKIYHEKLGYTNI